MTDIDPGKLYLMQIIELTGLTISEIMTADYKLGLTKNVTQPGPHSSKGKDAPIGARYWTAEEVAKIQEFYRKD